MRLLPSVRTRATTPRIVLSSRFPPCRAGRDGLCEVWTALPMEDTSANRRPKGCLSPAIAGGSPDGLRALDLGPIDGGRHSRLRFPRAPPLGEIPSCAWYGERGRRAAICGAIHSVPTQWRPRPLANEPKQSTPSSYPSYRKFRSCNSESAGTTVLASRVISIREHACRPGAAADAMTFAAREDAIPLVPHTSAAAVPETATA